MTPGMLVLIALAEFALGAMVGILLYSGRQTCRDRVADVQARSFRAAARIDDLTTGAVLNMQEEFERGRRRS